MSTSKVGLRALATGRTIVGSSMLLMPLQAGPLFGVPLNSSAAVLGRLFGIRDLLMAIYLWRATNAYLQESTHGHARDDTKINSNYLDCRDLNERDLKSVLSFGLICDSVDVVSCLVCILEGNLTDLAKVLAAGGAALFAVTGFFLRKPLV